MLLDTGTVNLLPLIASNTLLLAALAHFAIAVSSGLPEKYQCTNVIDELPVYLPLDPVIFLDTHFRNTWSA